MPKTLMPVTIRGTTYPSVRAAADALGVTPSTIYSALGRGREDTIGIGPGHRPVENRLGGNPKPITLGGVTYRSKRAASIALGMSKGYVTDVLSSRKKTAAKQGLIRLAMERTAQNENAALRDLRHG